MELICVFYCIGQNAMISFITGKEVTGGIVSIYKAQSIKSFPDISYQGHNEALKWRDLV